ncbi:MAG: hypothetical protein AAF804_00270, partial [Bacteroidota bacterium]
FLLGAALMWTGCGSTDLSLLNSVKRFEPEWMDLSEKVTEMEDLLRRTHLRYESFLEFAGPQLNNPEANRRYDLSSARSQYRNIISERDRIEQEFGQQKEEFIKAVSEFNQWQNKLMQDKKSGETAQSEFGDYQTRYRGLAESIGKLDADLTRNIEESNSMVRKVCNALGSARRDRYLIDPSRI